MNEPTVVAVLLAGISGIVALAATIIKVLWAAYREKGKALVIVVEQAVKSADGLTSAIDLQRLREEEMFRQGERMHKEAMDKLDKLGDDIRGIQG